MIDDISINWPHDGRRQKVTEAMKVFHKLQTTHVNLLLLEERFVLRSPKPGLPK